MSRSKIDVLAMLFAVALSGATEMAAQVSGDSIKPPAPGPTHAWLSLGLGGGGSSSAHRSSGGPLAARAAVSVAVNPVVMFTLEEAIAGGYDASVEALSLLAGVKVPAGNDFFFFTAGGAATSCGSECRRETGFAFNAGCHFAEIEKGAGVGLAVFVIRAHRSQATGVVVTLDLGSFGR